MTYVPLMDLMEPNQAIFLYHLRSNPHNIIQITNDLVQDETHMCVLGLGMEAFGMIKKYNEMLEEQKTKPYSQRLYPEYDLYDDIAGVLNIPVEHVHEVYSLNDDYGLSFNEIADALEEYFKDRKQTGGSPYSGPIEFYESQVEALRTKEAEEFAAVWVNYQKKLAELLLEARTALEATVESVNDFSAEDLDIHDKYDSYEVFASSKYGYM